MAERPVTTMARWEHDGVAVMAKGNLDGSHTGPIGCTPKGASWWKASVQAMKELDMPFRDPKKEREAKRTAKGYRIGSCLNSV